MTSREQINQRKRRILIITMIVFPVIVCLGAFLGLGRNSRSFGLVAACCIFLAAVQFSAYWIMLCCPGCGGRLGDLAYQKSRLSLAISPLVRYCPYCGQDFDAKETAKPVIEHEQIV